MNSCIYKCFKKIRIGKHKTDPHLEVLFVEKEHLMEYLSRAENEDDVVIYEKSEESSGKVNEAIEGFSQQKTWKLKKKLAPK